jgi:hypothetical protein
MDETGQAAAQPRRMNDVFPDDVWRQVLTYVRGDGAWDQQNFMAQLTVDKHWAVRQTNSVIGKSHTR